MKRAWVIGNGPSLLQTNLDLLKDEITYATNRIYLIFDKTSWRPTYYVYNEPFGGLGRDLENQAEDIKQAFMMGIQCYMQKGVKGTVVYRNLRRFQKRTSGEDYFESCQHNNVHFDDPSVPREWHLPTICAFGSSVHAAIQIAVKEGYGPIYLLGCDLGYTNSRNNWFSPEYDRGEDRRDEYYMNRDMIEAHKIALRSSPVPIFNCTVGGSLEVYPRRKMEDVLQNSADEYWGEIKLEPEASDNLTNRTQKRGMVKHGQNNG